MHSTTFTHDLRTRTIGGEPAPDCNPDLLLRYQSMLDEGKLQWAAYQRLERVLGRGGQGVVYYSTRIGADGFALPVAIKIFSPERLGTQAVYDHAMSKIGRVASEVARIQHDGVLSVYDFIDRNRIRLMIMEWIDGYDLRELLRLERLSLLRSHCSHERWEYLNNVVITAGPLFARFKAGIAVAIVRDCLAALAAMHRAGIVHGDIKPSNIMIKRTGYAKLIDFGSAFLMGQQPPIFTVTPVYAAPEVLENAPVSPRSDLASLGYVLIELLSGRPCFAETESYRELMENKRMLPQRLHEILPPEVSCNELLMSFCKGLIAPDPTRRFPSAEAAELLHEGAASFHRQLVLNNMASEYEHDIRIWIEDLKRIDEHAGGGGSEG
ncbi:MAG: serine/threonine-protein kinase [Planctomycetota bacterium]|jgi:serine/threonine-protein kinase